MGSAEPPTAAADSVSASDLARHFGHWQRRALKSPIYIMNHGRPQFVLASVEFMQALSAAQPALTDDAVGELLDALPDPVLVCDAGGVIIAAGRAARLYFGMKARPGVPLSALLPRDVTTVLKAVVARVAASGLSESAELPGAAGRASLDLLIDPWSGGVSGGVVIVGRAAGLADARDVALAREAALANAVAKLPVHAVALISPRGRLLTESPTLARLVGRSTGDLLDAPVAGLFANGSRAAVEGAVDAVFRTGAAGMIRADLMTNDSAALPVQVGLAAVRRGLAIDAVQAVLAGAS